MDSYTLRDVLWAISTINKFASVKEAIDSIIRQLATKGVRVSDYDLQNPASLLPIFLEAKKMGINVDISDLEKAINEAGDLSFDDVDKALRILSEYNYLNDEIDRTFRNIIDNSGMSMKQLGFIANLFGLNVGLPSYNEESSTASVEFTDPEDYEQLKKFIKAIKKKSKA